MRGALAQPETQAASSGFGWLAIIRIGLVQASIGALVMLTTAVLNRLMVVEFQLAAAIPAGHHVAARAADALAVLGGRRDAADGCDSRPRRGAGHRGVRSTACSQRRGGTGSA